MPEEKRPLKVFLSYASQDKPVVRELSRRLVGEGWIDTWFDEKKLLPGQDWRLKIEDAVETSDIVIICLSHNSVTKEGYVQKEIRYAREIALEKPEETIFIIPLRLDGCDVPRGLRFYQWVDYFGEKKDEAYKALLESLKWRHDQKLRIEEQGRVRQEREKVEREAAEKAAREEAERKAAEKAAQKKAELEAAGKMAREIAEREAAEKALREEAEQEAAERAARGQAEREAAEKAAREKAEREAAEKIAHEKVEKETAEKAAREKAEKEAAEKAAREKAEKEAAEKAAREKAQHLAVEKAKRERAERQAIRKALLQRTFSRVIEVLKTATLKLIPFFRIIGILGIIALLLWGGSLVVPKFIEIMPTVKPSLTLEPTATKLIAEVSPSMTFTHVPSFTATLIETPTLTPIATPVEITDNSGVEMVLIPAGEFIMGNDEVANAKPAHKVYLDTYYLDKYEVTNAQYRECVEGRICGRPSRLSVGSTCIYPNPQANWPKYYSDAEFDSFPVVNVTWEQANIFCQYWRNARLPTEAEWEKAARGVGEQIPGWSTWYTCSIPNAVGTDKIKISPYGVYDMFGNVMEYVADWYDREYYQTLSGIVSNPTGPVTGDSHVVRGESTSSRVFFSTSAIEDYLGFRCAKDETP
jgi:formylglycine-generating enzyme required for sulfatase activity